MHEQPQYLKKYGGGIEQLGIGKTGKVGIIRLELESRHGKTILSKQFTQPPLQVQRVLYLESNLPGLAHIYLLSTSGGILQGDRYTNEITLNNNAIAHVTTQGATRIYGMNADYATYTTKLKVNEGCYLEYIPDQIIPYAKSRYYQMTDVTVHDTATLIHSEILAPGRTAMKESFAYDICNLRFRYQDQNKILVYDNTKIEPAKQRIHELGVMSKDQFLGTTYIISKRCNLTRLQDDILDHMQQIKSISFGVSVLANSSGIIIRMLGTNTNDLVTATQHVLDASRNSILGVSLHKPRKC